MVANLISRSRLRNMVKIDLYNATTVMNGEIFQIISLVLLLIVSVEET